MTSLIFKRNRSGAGIDRRTFIEQSCALGAAIVLPALGSRAASAAESPVAETTAGKILGVSSGGVHSFKGVPYGAPTSGSNRFMPPQKPQAWAGVRSATEFAGRAPQSPSANRQRPELTGLYLANGFSGHGVMHSPATGRALSEIILDGRASFLDVSCLSFERFAKGELLHETAFP